MDNNMNPFAPQPSSRPDAVPPFGNPAEQAAPSVVEQQPAQAPAAEQPATNPGLPPAMDQDPNSQPQSPTAPTMPLSHNPVLNNTGVKLESPILAPTHFDNLKNPNMNPAQAVPQSAVATQTPEQKAKLYMTLSIVFGALAFVGIILGIWSLVSNISTSNTLKSTQDSLKNANAIIAKVEEETGTVINSPDNVPAYTPVTGYIYLDQWGIKFKIPDDLSDVSYTLDAKYRPQVCFTGYKTGMKYFPAFADIDQNTKGLGCVTRVQSYEGDSDKDTGASFGQPIYSYGDYNYFYNAPEGHFSQDAAEQGLEDTAVQIIKNMVANNISHYE